MVKYNEGLIQGILAKHVTKKLKIPYYFVNLYAFYEGTNELDFVYIDEYGYSIEWEIKTALNDFRDDFRLKKVKHELLKSSDVSCPNRFYFVAPSGVIPVEEVPENCGVIEISVDSKGDFRLRTVKKAPLIHSNKDYTPTDFFDKIYYQLTKFQNIWFGEKLKKFKKDLKDEGLIDPNLKSSKTKNPRRRATSRRSSTRRTSRRKVR